MIGCADVTWWALRIVGRGCIVAGLLHVVLGRLTTVRDAIASEASHAGTDGRARQRCSGLVTDDGTRQCSEGCTTRGVCRGAVAGVGIVGATGQRQCQRSDQ